MALGAYLHTAHFNSRIPQKVKYFAVPFDSQTAIISPLILIIISDEVADGPPIFPVDLREEMCAVQSDLPLRLPPCDKPSSGDHPNEKSGINAVPKTNRHSSQ